jgi:hypothetical protein
MVNTSTNPLTVVKNGTEVRLDTMAFNISTKSGIVGMAAAKGNSASVPGRHGSLYKRGRRRDEGRVILSMWANDTDVDGVLGTDRYKTWRTNMDKLLQIFDTTHGQVELREYLDPAAPTVYRRATCEVRAAIDPEVLGRTFGQFKVECIINAVFWESYDVTTFTSPTSAAAIATHNMTNFLDMTAPIEDAVISVDGPIANPIITDPLSGHNISFAGTIANGTQWRIDSGLFETATGVGINFTPGSGSSATLLTTAKGSYAPRLFGTTPELQGTAPRITLAGTGTGAATRLRVQARRKFH